MLVICLTLFCLIYHKILRKKEKIKQTDEAAKRRSGQLEQVAERQVNQVDKAVKRQVEQLKKAICYKDSDQFSYWLSSIGKTDLFKFVTEE